MSVFLTFPKEKTTKERWHSLVSHMGDREEYLETPLPLPQNLYGWTDVRSQPLSQGASALRALNLRYKMKQSHWLLCVGKEL